MARMKPISELSGLVRTRPPAQAHESVRTLRTFGEFEVDGGKTRGTINFINFPSAEFLPRTKERPAWREARRAS